MRQYLLIIFFTMLSLSAKAQVKVSGTVTDAAGQPLS